MKPVLKRALPVLAVAVLLPLTLGITFQNEWVGYNSSRPSQPVTVGAGESVEFAGAGWTVTDVSTVAASSDPGQEIGLPPRTQLVTVTVEVTPDELVDGESPSCTVSLQELDGAAVLRNWQDATFSDIDYSPEDPIEWGCSSDLTAPYSFEAWFVVPDDVGDEVSLSVEVTEELPRYLRFAL